MRNATNKTIQLDCNMINYDESPCQLFSQTCVSYGIFQRVLPFLSTRFTNSFQADFPMRRRLASEAFRFRSLFPRKSVTTKRFVTIDLQFRSVSRRSRVCPCHLHAKLRCRYFFSFFPCSVFPPTFSLPASFISIAFFRPRVRQLPKLTRLPLVRSSSSQLPVQCRPSKFSPLSVSSSPFLPPSVSLFLSARRDPTTRFFYSQARSFSFFVYSFLQRTRSHSPSSCSVTFLNAFVKEQNAYAFSFSAGRSAASEMPLYFPENSIVSGENALFSRVIGQRCFPRGTIRPRLVQRM